MSKVVGLRCQSTTLPNVTGVSWAEAEVPLTIGKTYAIVGEWTDFEGDIVVYAVLGDDGEPRTYSKFPDEDGLSYATWFAAIMEEDVN